VPKEHWVVTSVPQEAVESVVRTVRQTLVFSGRSTTRDVIYLWIVVGLITMAAKPFIDASLPWDAAAIARVGVDVFLTLPFFALYVRRLHDQNRSGWWVLALPPMMAVSIYQRLHVTFIILDPNWPENHSHSWDPWGLVLLPFVAALIVFMFLPGTVGPNRYGPDPREGAEAASAT
jgi:uncharacterized membrane protein YhaH (DUF805 family)